MIRVSCDDRRRSIELLDDNETDQHVGQCEWTERPALVGAREDIGGVTVRTANHNGEIATTHAPRRELPGELFARPGFSAAIEGNDVRILGQGVEHQSAFIGDGACAVSPLAALAKRYLDQIKREFVRKSLAVFGEAVRHPRRHALTDGDQADFHRRRFGTVVSVGAASASILVHTVSPAKSIAAPAAPTKQCTHISGSCPTISR